MNQKHGQGRGMISIAVLIGSLSLTNVIDSYNENPPRVVPAADIKEQTRAQPVITDPIGGAIIVNAQLINIINQYQHSVNHIKDVTSLERLAALTLLANQVGQIKPQDLTVADRQKAQALLAAVGSILKHDQEQGQNNDPETQPQNNPNPSPEHGAPFDNEFTKYFAAFAAGYAYSVMEQGGGEPLQLKRCEEAVAHASCAGANTGVMPPLEKRLRLEEAVVNGCLFVDVPHADDVSEESVASTRSPAPSPYDSDEEVKVALDGEVVNISEELNLPALKSVEKVIVGWQKSELCSVYIQGKIGHHIYLRTGSEILDKIKNDPSSKEFIMQFDILSRVCRGVVDETASNVIWDSESNIALVVEDVDGVEEITFITAMSKSVREASQEKLLAAYERSKATKFDYNTGAEIPNLDPNVLVRSIDLGDGIEVLVPKRQRQDPKPSTATATTAKSKPSAIPGGTLGPKLAAGATCPCCGSHRHS